MESLAFYESSAFFLLILPICQGLALGLLVGFAVEHAFRWITPPDRSTWPRDSVREVARDRPTTQGPARESGCFDAGPGLVPGRRSPEASRV